MGQFQKGQSGNPKGRRSDKPFKDALRMELAAVEDDDHKSLRRIARRLIDAAATGDLAAIKELADRLDGKPRQETDVNLETEAEMPTRIEIVPITHEEVAARRARGELA